VQRHDLDLLHAEHRPAWRLGRHEFIGLQPNGCIPDALSKSADAARELLRQRLIAADGGGPQFFWTLLHARRIRICHRRRRAKNRGNYPNNDPGSDEARATKRPNRVNLLVLWGQNP
jgi:hypothetical protein